MKAQEKVADFVEKHDMEAAQGFRLLDLVSEVGELAKDATKTSEYGLSPEKFKLKEDEVGDVMFSLLALADHLGIDAEKALENSIEKYRERIDERGEPGSGSHS